MNVPNLSVVPLQQASLCLDCEMITAAATFPACGSAALMNMARALSGPGYRRDLRVRNRATADESYRYTESQQSLFIRRDTSCSGGL
jgi:hypothetical protein